MNQQFSKVLTTADVLALTRVSRTVLYTTLLKKQGFPKPFKIGERNNAWFRNDVEAWLDGRAKAVAA